MMRYIEEIEQNFMPRLKKLVNEFISNKNYVGPFTVIRSALHRLLRR